MLSNANDCLPTVHSTRVVCPALEAPDSPITVASFCPAVILWTHPSGRLSPSRYHNDLDWWRPSILIFSRDLIMIGCWTRLRNSNWFTGGFWAGWGQIEPVSAKSAFNLHKVRDKYTYNDFTYATGDTKAIPCKQILRLY